MMITRAMTAVIAVVLAAAAAGALDPLLKSGQTTSFGPGSDGDLQTGVSRSFTDNGDGTITDNVTGLMWEKKSDDGGIHDVDNGYTWGQVKYPPGVPYEMDGTMVTTFLAALNAGGGFAGHTDWRVPNRFELGSLRDLENVNPMTYPAFDTGCVPGCTVTACSCTGARPLGPPYWSSTTYQSRPDRAWTVDFTSGDMLVRGKGDISHVRAVRGGS